MTDTQPTNPPDQDDDQDDDELEADPDTEAT